MWRIPSKCHKASLVPVVGITLFVDTVFIYWNKTLPAGEEIAADNSDANLSASCADLLMPSSGGNLTSVLLHRSLQVLYELFLLILSTVE